MGIKITVKVAAANLASIRRERCSASQKVKLLSPRAVVCDAIRLPCAPVFLPSNPGGHPWNFVRLPWTPVILSGKAVFLPGGAVRLSWNLKYLPGNAIPHPCGRKSLPWNLVFLPWMLIFNHLCRIDLPARRRWSKIVTFPPNSYLLTTNS